MRLDKTLSKIQNASRARKTQVLIEDKPLLRGILQVLVTQGLIRGYHPHQGKLAVFLKYNRFGSLIQEIQCLSTPGHPSYLGAQDLWQLQISSLLILSTSEGVMDHRQACQQGLGGQALCQIK